MAGSPLAFAATALTSGQQGSKGPPAQASIEHAFLEVRDPPPKGKSQPGGRRDEIKFQFNPKELKLSKSAKWKRDPQRNKKSSGVPQYNGSDPVKFTVDMFLDATTTMDDSVVKTVEKLFKLTVPTDESLSSTRKACPPVVIFHWGGLTGFVCFVSQVSVTYSLFTPGGTPVRAVAQVTLEELTPEFPPQNPTSGSYRPRRTHRIVEGDSLQSVAWREYGDAARWREIADLNGIDDPMRLAPGTTVLLPAAEDLTGVVER